MLAKDTGVSSQIPHWQAKDAWWTLHGRPQGFTDGDVKHQRSWWAFQASCPLRLANPTCTELCAAPTCCWQAGQSRLLGVAPQLPTGCHVGWHASPSACTPTRALSQMTMPHAHCQTSARLPDGLDTSRLPHGLSNLRRCLVAHINKLATKAACPQASAASSRQPCLTHSLHMHKAVSLSGESRLMSMQP